MTIGNMIKKELAVYHRVPGSSDQNTDLDITLLMTEFELPDHSLIIGKQEKGTLEF